MNDANRLRLSIRRWIVFFIIALLLSGITAFPIESELAWVCSWWPDKNGIFYQWLYTCYSAIAEINQKYPFLAYGYDWLAFAHIVIAIAFIGPYKDPVRNSWIIQWGMIACVLVIPLALIAGAVRQIPLYWRLIDCSFGVVGIFPLFIVSRRIRALASISSSYRKRNVDEAYR